MAIFGHFILSLCTEFVLLTNIACLPIPATWRYRYPMFVLLDSLATILYIIFITSLGFNLPYKFNGREKKMDETFYFYRLARSLLIDLDIP
jgi:hypothetical protein